MGWDGVQREVLAALGHDLLVLADPPLEASVAAALEGAPVLVAALARAGDCTVAELAPLPPLERLRSPQGKRALWPRLRALRRSRRR